MRMRANRCLGVALTVLVVALTNTALAAGASKGDAVAMVKKAVAAINSEGTEKAYAEIDDLEGPFVDRDLYIVVYRMDCLVLAHGADKKRIGVNLLQDKDVDGKEFVKERVELAKTEPSFWQNYRFMNPVTKTVAPKQMYCERLNDTVVYGGVY